jgi:transposase InsO family protein
VGEVASIRLLEHGPRIVAAGIVLRRRGCHFDRRIEHRGEKVRGRRVKAWPRDRAQMIASEQYRRPRLAGLGLKRQFTVTRPNKAWVTDIAYIRTWESWLYLAVVMDLFSRKIVGWSVSATIHREVVLDAIIMAVRRRRPRQTLIHSDQVTQYGCDAWRRFCRSNHLEPSMSRKGNCWDNAVAESFFSSLKKERVKKQIYKNRELATADISEYIDSFYYRKRRHSHLGGVSPEDFESAHRKRQIRSTESWELQSATPNLSSRSALPNALKPFFQNQIHKCRCN